MKKLFPLLLFFSCTKAQQPYCQTWLVQKGYTTTGMYCNHIGKPVTEHTFCYSAQPRNDQWGKSEPGAIIRTGVSKDTVFYCLLVKIKIIYEKYN